MSVLVIRLAGPLQAWGTSSKLADRGTDLYPSKSGVVGLLANALGRTREDDISDLAKLGFGVAVYSSGNVIKDTQTAVLNNRSYAEAKANERYFFSKQYLSDAIFLCGIECSRELAEQYRDALLHPARQLFLGRRSCPATLPFVKGIFEESLEETLKKAAADENSERQKRGFKPKKRFQLVLDSSSGLMEHDIPVSFSAEKRLFAGRMVQIKDFDYVSEQNHT